ncbi:MAG: AbrB/MazE/SpoVT family DNA-binding domain-containing protein [Chloroflexi bacterium]|nr:AbrB/MazE/SpoVT family DNA-binding domain-containing protein [Chloroflexota bacterium]
MALKLKVCDENIIAIPRSILERLSLKEGDRMEVRLDANRLILQGVADKLAALRRFRGIWKDEEVEKVFQEINEEWDKWNERLHA